ncbi:MAG: hypothetical protein HY026_04460 [Deltaproteobacteria bacterium]|nr:hypothetical protein [Deltaproteobacteria bacterium]
MKKKTQKSKARSLKFIFCEIPRPCIAKYLVVIANKGMTSEVNYFDSLKEANQAFGEIANDYGYEPDEINSSDYHDVSIWKWTEDRYEKVFPKDKRLT